MRTTMTMAIALLTGIGGHFLNRRWDRALFFFGLIFLWGFGGGYLLTRYTFTTLSFDSPQQVQELFRRYYLIIVAGLGVIWLLSMLVTWRDLGRHRRMLQRWTAGGAIGALLLTAIGAGFVVRQGNAYYAMTVMADEMATEGEPPPSYGDPVDDIPNFWHYLAFGGLVGNDRELPPPPEGAGILRGRLIHAGEPAGGVTLNLILNGRYRSRELVTDASGFFALPIEPGEWFVNAIQTNAWAGKPEGRSFLLVSGKEDRLEGTRFERHPWLGQKGRRVVVSEDGGDVALTLEIREEIDLAWPTGRDAVTASVDGSAVEWSAYPGASDYLVEVFALRREGRTTHFEELARRRISDDTRLPLSALTLAEGGDAGREYQVQVYAFAPDGTFLSESGQFPEATAFRLADGMQIVDEESLAAFGQTLSGEELESLGRNREYLDAVEVLIDTDLLGAADRLLQRVEGIAPPGRRQLMTGYLLASRGECGEARAAFAAAQTEAPQICIAAEYYRDCAGE